ncbi:MerR family DNA-binding protein [Kribbella italica]|uniref:DNA-binding transcriptional MerR regulator n=1 Tax=Kribbella italica TaxID=1540520 RepID=A0A7W9MXV8_9ACTN|nr:MerR family DNA-binding protein [Kribbella italica]MBB5839478.1 DNA-binding transcriptional MerR regulator [Kribbella italica]
MLRPSSRSPSGHRLYAGEDVRRPHRIVALRGFGLNLAEIGLLLDGEVPDPRGLIRRQLDQVETQLAAATQLHDRLLEVLTALDATEAPSNHTLLNLIEGMTTMTRLTQHQLEEMTARRQEFHDSLTPTELANLDTSRRQALESMTKAELEDLRQRRATAMPR